MSHLRKRRTATLAALAVGAAALTATAVATAEEPADGADGAMSPFDVEDRGADVPFVEHEAEEAATDGTLIGPDSAYLSLPGEASGRQAVTLDAVGEYVEFTLTEPANAMTLRYSIPDSPQGAGRDAPIDLLVDGQEVQQLPLTSRYGWYYGSYPFTNDPGAGNGHHFYDHVRTMFDQTLDAGTKVRVQVSSTADSPTFTIDLADFEVAPNRSSDRKDRCRSWTSGPTRPGSPMPPPPSRPPSTPAANRAPRCGFPRAPSCCTTT
ncbi:hypothetical protein GCM10029992_28360 [Glycomyces albus]